MVEQLFRNNFKIYIFYIYYISGFLRRTKKLAKSPSCFDVYLINWKSPGSFRQMFVAFWKKSELYKADFFCTT